MKHPLSWFTDRIGKRVFRTKNTCECPTCTKVTEEGIIIKDESHAEYLSDVQHDIDLNYYDV